MMKWVTTRSPLVRTLAYAALAALAFALAAGVGATGALMLRGDVAALLERQESRPADEQDVGRAQQKEGASGQERAAADESAAASPREEAEYADAVEDVQTGAVEAFVNSHRKLLRYDALAADDVERMRANEAALQEISDRAGDLAPPRKYEEQHEVFVSAIDEMSGAAGLAYGMAADPVSATGPGFDEYDGRVDEASALLQRSNALLGEDYEAIEGVQEVSPEL